MAPTFRKATPGGKSGNSRPTYVTQQPAYKGPVKANPMPIVTPTGITPAKPPAARGTPKRARTPKITETIIAGPPTKPPSNVLAPIVTKPPIKETAWGRGNDLSKPPATRRVRKPKLPRP